MKIEEAKKDERIAIKAGKKLKTVRGINQGK